MRRAAVEVPDRDSGGVLQAGVVRASRERHARGSWSASRRHHYQVSSFGNAWRMDCDSLTEHELYKGVKRCLLDGLRVIPCVLAGFVLAVGCIGEPPTELDDPAAALGGTEWTDRRSAGGGRSDEFDDGRKRLRDAPPFSSFRFRVRRYGPDKRVRITAPRILWTSIATDDIGDTVVASAAGKVTRVD